jgi:hypothetical protein
MIPLCAHGLEGQAITGARSRFGGVPSDLTGQRSLRDRLVSDAVEDHRLTVARWSPSSREGGGEMYLSTVVVVVESVAFG